MGQLRPPVFIILYIFTQFCFVSSVFYWRNFWEKKSFLPFFFGETLPKCCLNISLFRHFVSAKFSFGEIFNFGGNPEPSLSTCLLVRSDQLASPRPMSVSDMNAKRFVLAVYLTVKKRMVQGPYCDSYCNVMSSDGKENIVFSQPPYSPLTPPPPLHTPISPPPIWQWKVIV